MKMEQTKQMIPIQILGDKSYIKYFTVFGHKNTPEG